MRLRILLPPAFSGCAQRNAVPAKVELAGPAGQRIPPEKCQVNDFADLPDAERSALFALSKWCDGKLASFLQLNLDQTAELIRLLQGLDCFFVANSPDEPMRWISTGLEGVSEYLPALEQKPAFKKIRTIKSDQGIPEQQKIKAIKEPPDYLGPPIEVEGSTEYLRIILPGSEHPAYAKTLKMLRDSNFLRDRSHRHWWWLRDPSKVLDFLAFNREELENAPQTEFTGNFLRLTAKVKKAVLKIEAEENDDQIEIRTMIEAGNAPVEKIEQALATGRNHFKHGENTYLLTKDLRQRAAQAQSHASGRLDAPVLARSSHLVSRFESTSLEHILIETDPKFQPPPKWKKRAIALRDLSCLPPPKLSDGMEKILRPYQALGVAWMLHLFDHELGGILADEMGLGKTLQALSLISALRKRGGPVKTSLVLCPATLLENWKREAERFFPGLATYLHHGPKRANAPSFLSRFDLVITSYGTLTRDLEIFREVPFLCVIGDEAQHLRNRKSQNAKAATALHSEGRMLLTGTPVENSVSDLTSLLDFLLPGAHPPLPSGARAEERTWSEQRILKQAGPYVLRRTKREVAPELPQKIEQTIYLQLSVEQRNRYEEIRRSAELELDRLADSGASEGALRMKTLTQLLRLRQVCCDPRLIDPSFDPFASCKLRCFRELLYNCLENGHRILVFSQFVKLLKLLRQELEQASLSHCYLDGSSTDRMEQVDRFQENESIPVFLLSLKAGGVGLNLTGADVVLHFDPWWNPAVENQASDRAHRIGQLKTVTVYKFITVATVEEKVLQLQNEKRKILENVFEESEAANLSLSLSDLRELI